MLVGLVGLAGHGKSEAARYLIEQGFHRIKFAGPLKAMMRALLCEQGVPPDMVERMIEGDLKEEPAGELGWQTPRHAMQTLGTEWGRDCMGKHFWVDCAKSIAGAAMRSGKAVVIDDVRFPNEGEAIKRLGGIIVRVIRPMSFVTSVASTQHPSETEMCGVVSDYNVLNDGTVQDLHRAVGITVSHHYPNWSPK